MTSSGTASGPVRVRVCAVLTHDGVCLIRRQREAGLQHSLPGGVVEDEDGEEPADALRRELLEELGLDLAVLPAPPVLRFVQDQDQETERPGESVPFRRRHLVYVAHLPDRLVEAVAAAEQDAPDEAPVVWLPVADAAGLHLYPDVGAVLAQAVPARHCLGRRAAAAPGDDRRVLSVALTPVRCCRYSRTVLQAQQGAGQAEVLHRPENRWQAVEVPQDDGCVAAYLYNRHVADDEYRQRVRRHRPSSLLPLVAAAAVEWGQPGQRHPWLQSPYQKYTPWALADVARVALNFGTEFHRAEATKKSSHLDG